jgi:carboxymethylenebutenolidase
VSNWWTANALERSIMIEKEIALSTKHGVMPTFAVYPGDGGPHPAIIFYMDAPGVREELRVMARRIARQGYYCVLPDLYYRLGTLRFDTHRRNDSMSTVIKSVRQSLSNALVMDDTAAIFSFLDGEEAVKPGKAGVVGYCMSGQYVVAAAGRFPERVAGAASLYGMDILTDKEDSPHLLLDRVKAELYLAFAEVDPVVPNHTLPPLRAALDKAGTKYEMKQFSGTHHGFCFVERQVFDWTAAEEAWAKQFALWRRTLG